MFRYRLLIEALRAADPAIATDEARAVETLGLKARLVMGSTSNIKVTFPEDLALAELIIGSRRKDVVSREPRAASRQQKRKPKRGR
jgi:2-C-methyl-D-erythritol 4-phosphate cytidylyltransferase